MRYSNINSANTKSNQIYSINNHNNLVKGMKSMANNINIKQIQHKTSMLSNILHKIATLYLTQVNHTQLIMVILRNKHCSIIINKCRTPFLRPNLNNITT